jgi:hypothetical protein
LPGSALRFGYLLSLGVVPPFRAEPPLFMAGADIGKRRRSGGVHELMGRR